jgi:uncharacterized membrane protein
MSWLQRYRVRHYFRNSTWLLPALSTLAAIGLLRLLHGIEVEMAWVSPIDSDTARAVLATLASAMLTAIVFVCSSLLVAVQLASATLTPRIIGLVFRDRVTKFSLTLFVFTFTFSLSALIRIHSTVPLLTTHGSAYGCLICLVVFFYLIDHLGKTLRPSGVLRAVAGQGRQVIESVYPQLLSEAPAGPGAAALASGEEPTATIPSLSDGVVLAFDQKGLLSMARRADCVIELVPQVGDHVAAGDPLFRIFHGGGSLSAGALRRSVAVGQERTLEQDPTFPFRIMVDIASKALSPAINDPTTAVLALDQIHHLLRTVGNRRLDNGRIQDAKGRLRLVYRTPDWADFVWLAVTEIRQFGGKSIQVARRLHAMLENLIQTLPEARTAPLRQVAALVDRSAERSFAEPEDRALAAVSDVQGVGGKGEEQPKQLAVPASAHSATPRSPEGVSSPPVGR